MAKITLTGGWSLVPEGTHIFQITEVNYKEGFGKLEVTMETHDGLKHIERFSLLDAKGKPNTGAYNAFSYFARAALNDFELTEIDHEDLIGCFLECDVEHTEQPSTKNPGKTVTYVRLIDKRPSDGWATAAPAPAAKVGKPDLAALLG